MSWIGGCALSGCELVKKTVVEEVTGFIGESVVLPCVCSDLQDDPKREEDVERTWLLEDIRSVRESRRIRASVVFVIHCRNLSCVETLWERVSNHATLTRKSEGLGTSTQDRGARGGSEVEAIEPDKGGRISESALRGERSPSRLWLSMVSAVSILPCGYALPVRVAQHYMSLSPRRMSWWMLASLRNPHSLGCIWSFLRSWHGLGPSWISLAGRVAEAACTSELVVRFLHCVTASALPLICPPRCLGPGRPIGARAFPMFFRCARMLLELRGAATGHSPDCAAREFWNRFAEEAVMMKCLYLLSFVFHITAGCALTGKNDIEITQHKGGSVLLPCSCSDLLSKPQKFTWETFRTGQWAEVLNDEHYLGRYQLFNNIFPANLSLLISDLREEDHGNYRCSTELQEYRYISLYVKGSPRLTTKIGSDRPLVTRFGRCELVKKTGVEKVTGFTGESVVLPCVCTDLQNYPKRVTWEFNKNNHFQEIYPKQTGHHSNRVKLVSKNPPGNLSLLLSDLTEEDQGTYICTAQADYRYLRLSVKGTFLSLMTVSMFYFSVMGHITNQCCASYSYSLLRSKSNSVTSLITYTKK
ncbi:hypothetical protein C0J45_16126 [Silurus meridionalis]|nr:hypothetical protein C0J45_16126 [Silurus meridionalis]